MAGATIDIDALLAPITGENPCGESLRYADAYDAIQEARRADDPNLPQGDWKREIKSANWRQTISLCCDAIASKSKDLQIAAWLTEALARQNGFAGARDGMLLLAGLQERFWEGLFPEIQDGDLEYRGGALEWLNEKLPGALCEIPLTGAVETGEAYSLLRWRESRAVEDMGRKNPEARQAAIAEGKISAEEWDKAVALGDRAFYEEAFADLNHSLDEYKKLAALVDEKFGAQAPNLSAIGAALGDCRQVLDEIVARKRELEPAPVAAAAPSAATISEAAPAPAGNGAATAALAARVAGSIEPIDRADALKRLEAIAAFFHRSEPHSPVSYLIQRAVRWGQMPLEQWLTDVISDEAVLTHIRETLGIRSPGEGGG